MEAYGMLKVLHRAPLQNWIQSNWVSRCQDMDLLAKMTHHARLNAINNIKTILANNWF
jgi:hypothetical protein